MMPMTSMLPGRTSISLNRVRARAPWADLLVVAFLVGLDVAARLLPHAPNFTPVAASALFAAGILRVRGLSLLVAPAAMLLSDAMLGFCDWRVTVVVYGALSLSAGAACLSNRLRRPRMIVPVMLSSSLAFFVLTNFAVWAFTPMYAENAGGLVACYVAALPFLKYTVAGDLFWSAVLFGAYWFALGVRTAVSPGLKAEAVAVRARS
jgi:Family of unknown function (DUF6580)